MTVPDPDNLCRFVRPEDWNPEENRPKNSLFKAIDQKLSLFHVDRIGHLGSDLKDLCFGSFHGAGTAILSASVYRDEAKTGAQEIDAEVYFRPDDVKPEWAKWRYAHVNVETTNVGKRFPESYRVRLLGRLNEDNVEPPIES